MQKRDFSIYDFTKYNLLNEMSTESLKNMIRQDCFGSSDTQLDDTIIDMILDILSKREEKGGEIDVNTLWNNFESEYLSLTKQPDLPIQERNFNYSNNKIIKTPKKSLHTIRYALIAVLLCLLLGNCVTYASGFNLFDYVARWTEETFLFEKK